MMSERIRCPLVGLVTGVLIMVAGGQAQAKEYEHWDLLNQASGSSEYLGYKIAYRGFFTGYSWKNLADMVLFVRPAEGYQGYHVCQSVMRLSTENYPFAELFHPVRYEWIADNSPSLSYTGLVEVIDKGKSDNHHVIWLDWAQEQIKVYRKRELKPEKKKNHSSFLGEQWMDATKYVWEKDGAEALPDFLTHFPKVDEGRRSYLMHDKTVNDVKAETALDPLGTLALFRRHDFRAQGELEINITVDEDAKPHTAIFKGVEQLEIGDITLPALHIRVEGSEKDKDKNEGWMDIWLSDDARRLPLQFQVEAPVGKMRVQLTESSLKYNQGLKDGDRCFIDTSGETFAGAQ